VPKEQSLPPGWPRDKGRIGCLTCHDVTKACGEKARRTDENAKLLRDGTATATTAAAARAEFCQNCHAASAFEKFNPHAMLTAEREVIAERCLACHTEAPDRSARVRTGPRRVAWERDGAVSVVPRRAQGSV
jgi:nitrate reductase cytochrome c-type subunit